MSQLRNEFMLNALNNQANQANQSNQYNQPNQSNLAFQGQQTTQNIQKSQKDSSYSSYYNTNNLRSDYSQDFSSDRGGPYSSGYTVLDRDYSRQNNQSQNELLQPNSWGPSYNLKPPSRDHHLDSTGELHELANFTRYPSNPFDRQESREETNPFEGNNQNHYLRNTLGVFLENESTPFSEELSDKDHIDRRLKENERNRRKLATRLPRFHITKLPYFSIIVTTGQIIVFIIELARMGILTGSPFQTQPYFNPMLGPSTYLLVNMGARYVPCMHPIANVTLDMTLQFPCPNSTTVDTNVCNLSQLCGMGGIPIVNSTYFPDQRIRIVTPIFLHAGFLHILFNLMLQLAMGIAIEKHIGFIKYGLIYMLSGVGGFLLGANFAPNGIASTGASGSLFGIIAANLLLFIYCGRKNTNIYFTKKYTLFILLMVAEIVVSFVLGLLPGLDNFSHIGGFCIGLLLSIALLQDPSFVYIDGIYTYDATTTTLKDFLGNWNPLNKIHDKVRWKVAIWTILRLICMALVIVYFVLLTENLYSVGMEDNKTVCSWCKYINCIPVNGWCEMGEVTVTSTSNNNSPATQTANAFTSTSRPTPLPTQILNNRNFVDSAIRGGGTYIQSVTSKLSPDLPAAASNHLQEGTFVLVIIMAFLAYTSIWRLRNCRGK